jgi:hypothetical protein
MYLGKVFHWAARTPIPAGKHSHAQGDRERAARGLNWRFCDDLRVSESETDSDVELLRSLTTRPFPRHDNILLFARSPYAIAK